MSVNTALDHIDELGKAAYEHWTALHNRPVPWDQLPPYTRHKYRAIALAVLDADRGVTRRRARTQRVSRMERAG